MKKTILTLTVAAFALSAGAAFAGEKDKMSAEEHKAKMEAKVAEKFAAADADGSGTVSKEEFIAARVAAAEKEWADGADYLGDDGEASLEEVMAHQEAKMAKMKAKHKEHMEKKEGE